MAFANLITEGLDCRFNAFYRVDNGLFEECLENIPSYTNCLVCGINKLSNEQEVTYFVPQGARFEKKTLSALFDKPYHFDMVFFDTALNSIPVFSTPGMKIFRVNSISQFSSFISLLGYEEQNSFLFKDYIQSATLEKICIYILRDLHKDNFDIFQKINENFNNERLYKILSHIHQNIQAELTLEHLATLVYLSPDYISQFFKRCVGEGIQTYLIDQRVKMGLYNLVSTSDQIASIAENTGFVDQAYFNRRFKSVYKSNPLKIRKKYQLLSVSQAGTIMSMGRR
jgi:AraC-like DNA-binding protein